MSIWATPANIPALTMWGRAELQTPGATVGLPSSFFDLPRSFLDFSGLLHQRDPARWRDLPGGTAGSSSSAYRDSPTANFYAWRDAVPRVRFFQRARPLTKRVAWLDTAGLCTTCHGEVTLRAGKMPSLRRAAATTERGPPGTGQGELLGRLLLARCSSPVVLCSTLLAPCSVLPTHAHPLPLPERLSEKPAVKWHESCYG